MDTTFAQKWIRKFRILSLSLIFSGALNIGLIAAFAAILLQDRQPTLSFARPKGGGALAETSNGNMILAMSKLSFRELSACLTNKEAVEDGYLKRDLALAVLAAYRHLDVEKALGGSLDQRRRLVLGGDQTVEVYPGLTDEQFKAIIQFVYLEKWPLTAEGLFKLVQKTAAPRDPSLDQAFAMTPQFYALQLLFQKTEVPQETATLIDLASEGNWDLLDRFAKEQTQMLDLTVEKRRRLLLSYLSLHSKTAAELLVRTDFSFALKRLNDQGIFDLLDLLKGDDLNRFCVELMSSPRSDAVWEKCAALLYERAGEPLPTSLSLKEAKERFAPTFQQMVPAPKAAEPESPWVLHTVKDGESLWKIARQYKLKVEEISKANDLEKDRLYPGMTLRIPNKS